MSVEPLSTKAQVQLQVQVHDTTNMASSQVQVQVPHSGCMDDAWTSKLREHRLPEPHTPSDPMMARAGTTFDLVGHYYAIPKASRGYVEARVFRSPAPGRTDQLKTTKAVPHIDMPNE